METIGEVLQPLPLLPHTESLVDDNHSDRTHSNTASARNSTHGSDGIFDRNPLRSPINGSESEYEDEDDLISEMPTESHAPSCYGDEEQDGENDFLPYTPSRGHRSPFRNPSSVRGMQLDTTPPHLRSPTRESMNKHHSRLSIGSRNSTPRSIRSYRSGSPTKSKPTKKEQPLVLLHVTILPITCPYSQAVLEDVAPPHILSNWKLLREKVPDTVLERGILIPHPREEYEMLEERLLESLELAIPRILKCGHYHRETTDDESETEATTQTRLSIAGDDDSDADSDICTDCTRHVRDGSRGSNGTGKRRWNICIYAANGLMRAGAWSAAWREMERVDVEIRPWMEDGLRRELDLRRAQEEEDNARAMVEEQELHNIPETMDEERRREIYGDSAPSGIRTDRNFTLGDIVEAYEHGPEHEHVPDDLDTVDLSMANQESPSPLSKPASSIRVQKRHTLGSSQQDVPLTELLVNYAKLLLQDRRNVALVFMSVLVLWLALQTARTTAATPEGEVLPKNLEVAQPQVLPDPPQPIASPFSSVGEGLSSTLVEMVSQSLPTAPLDDSQGVGNESFDPVIEIPIRQ